MKDDEQPNGARRACYTPGPWKWRHAQLNENLAKALRKPRGKLTKKDGAVFLNLSGRRHDGMVENDGHLVNTCDFSNWHTVFRLRWDQVVGSTFYGGPSESDMALIQVCPEMYEFIFNMDETRLSDADRAERSRILERVVSHDFDPG